MFRHLLLTFIFLNPLHAGTITGTVPLPKNGNANNAAIEKYRGKVSGKVTKSPPLLAGVWLTSPTLKAPVKPASVTLNQKGYQFEKSLIVVSKNTEVFFPNKDPDYHHVFSLSRAKRFDIGRYTVSYTHLRAHGPY